jgi:nickel-type superoxide dismutase maturation protease
MSQCACATLGGATRSKASRTLSTSEGEVEGACINQLVYTRVLPIQRFRVEDTSMRPAVQPGDRLLVGRWLSPRPGDLVVLRDPDDTATFLLKRVAAVEPDGSISVQGDNPNVSRDSRHFGAVPRGLLVGRVFYRYLPPHRRRRL